MATTTLLPTRIQRVRIGNVPRPTSTSTPDVAHTLPDWAAEKRAFGSVTEPATSAPKATILPDVVVVELSTAITINHFSEYYGVSPTDTSQPRYHRLGDGSLVADPLVRDMQAQHIALFIIGMAFFFFVCTSLISLRILVSSKFKHKGIQYMLTLSQILGAMSYCLLFVGHLNDRVQCTPVIIASNGSVELANFLLIAILGVKAYRCRNNSRIVLVFLSICAAAFVGLAAYDMTRLRGTRRLAGSCIVQPGLPTFTPYLYVVQFVAAVFVCCCFVFTIWKSNRLAASRSRLSIHLESPQESVDVDGQSTGIIPEADYGTQRRGWWDYKGPTSPPLDDRNTRRVYTTLEKKPPVQSSMPLPITRKSSLRGEYPIPQPNRASTVRMSSAPEVRPRPASPTPSAGSRFAKFIPRVSVFREAMQDELKYTALIAGICCLSAILACAGVMAHEFLPSTGWTALNWSITSLLIIHSFQRVVRRHEDEALIRQTTAWDPTWRGRPVSNYSHARPMMGSRAWTPVSVATYRRGRRVSEEGTDENSSSAHEMQSVSHYVNSDFEHASLRSGISRVRLIDNAAEPGRSDIMNMKPWTARDGASDPPTATPTLSPSSPTFAEDVDVWKDVARWPQPGLSPDSPSFGQAADLSRQTSHQSSYTRYASDVGHPLGIRNSDGVATLAHSEHSSVTTR